MTCPATLPGPSHWRCGLPAGHPHGHVYRGDDWADNVHHDHIEEDL